MSNTILARRLDQARRIIILEGSVEDFKEDYKNWLDEIKNNRNILMFKDFEVQGRDDRLIDGNIQTVPVFLKLRLTNRAYIKAISVDNDVLYTLEQCLNTSGYMENNQNLLEWFNHIRKFPHDRNKKYRELTRHGFNISWDESD